jgi:hypothetical protein
MTFFWNHRVGVDPRSFGREPQLDLWPRGCQSQHPYAHSSRFMIE